MRILDRALVEIDLPFLERLCADRTPESVTHDYKSALPDRRDPDWKEKFLKDVSALANTAGGILVYGFDAPKKGDWQLPGLPGLDEDADVLSLLQVARSGIEPPLRHLEPRIVRRPGAGSILLLGIPRSLAAPHRLKMDYGGLYWRRTERGNESMTREELRRAFLEFDAWEREAISLVEERRSWLAAPGPRVLRALRTDMPLLLHILPLGRLRETRVSASEARSLQPSTDWISNAHGALQSHANVDGWLDYIVRPGNASANWLQIFRHGGAEACVHMRQFLDDRRPTSEAIIGNYVDGFVADVASSTFARMKRLGIEPPLSIHLAAAGVISAALVVVGSTDPANRRLGHFDRDDVAIPAIVVDDYSADAALVVRPALDIFWQAAGWPNGTPAIFRDGKILASS
jgi:hypothetical protein